MERAVTAKLKAMRAADPQEASRRSDTFMTLVIGAMMGFVFGLLFRAVVGAAIAIPSLILAAVGWWVMAPSISREQALERLAWETQPRPIENVFPGKPSESTEQLMDRADRSRSTGKFSEELATLRQASQIRPSDPEVTARLDAALSRRVAQLKGSFGFGWRGRKGDILPLLQRII